MSWKQEKDISNHKSIWLKGVKNVSWKIWITSIRATTEKMIWLDKWTAWNNVATSKMHISRKRAQNLKNLTFLHFITTFELKRCLSPFWKVQMSMMYVSVYGYFSWHKVNICTLKNKLFFELQLCPIDYETCRESWNLVLMNLGDTSTHTSHIFRGKACHNIPKQIDHFAWRYEVCPVNHSSCTKVNHLQQPDFFWSIIWLPHQQLWTIIEGTASLNQCQSLCLIHPFNSYFLGKNCHNILKQINNFAWR